MTSTFDKMFIPIFFVGILIMGGVWVGKTVYYIYHPPQDQEITFNVVGIVNATNSSIVSLHFECIKYCIDKINTEYTNRDKCYEQCARLGK